MQHISFTYNDKKETNKAIKVANSTKYKSQLLQVFTSQTDKSKIFKILTKLQKQFPAATLIGTTTAGEISHAKIYDNSTVISLSLFQKTKLKTHYVKKTNKKSGQEISRSICSKNTKAAVVLSEGLEGKDYEGFIKGIKQENPELIIAGGLAGDNFKLKNTFVFLNKKIYTSGAVAVSFTAKELYANNEYNLNWTPIGKEFTITQVEGNIVSKIDNEDAVKIFENYLGKEISQNNAAILPDFQLLFKEGETTVARTPLAIDKKSIIFAGPLQKGQVVQFGFSNASTVIKGSKDISKSILKNPAEAIYIYSCIARKTLLGKILEHEFSAFEDVAPTSGFFTYGEFYSTSANNALLNCTTTILVLSESNKKAKKSKKTRTIKENTLDRITFNALSHFVEQTAKELSSNIKLLNQYKDVVDNSSLVSKTDAKGFITYVNDSFCNISGYSKEELMGQNHNIIRDPSVSPFIFKKLWITITNGKVWKGTFPNRAKNGSVYYVEATIMPIFDKNNKIQEYIAIRRDVTKQIKAKKRLQEKEKLIKAILDNQDSIVIHASKTNGMQAVNKKLFDFFNYENFDDFKARNQCICDLFLQLDGYVNTKNMPNWLELISSNESDTFKVKMKIKDNTIHTFNLAVKRIDTDYIINLYDITALEDAITKAHSSEQAKSMFLSNMSHEIRTPLNGILGFTDILSKKDLDKDTKRYIDIIHKSGQTLLNVVNDILDFSKIESGELSLYETPANLFEEMEAAVATFSSLSRKNSIEYYTYIDPNIPKSVECDIQRLKQVINNLISNAMKFTREGGAVTVRILLEKLNDDRASISFSVRDSGIGIAKEKLPSIFKAFSQADNTISREFGGTGLGLAISNRYINMMGSNILVESEENQGSEFFFTITLAIVDHNKALSKTSSTTNLKIKMLYSQNKNACTINENISAYLEKWQCNYSKIYSLDEIDKETDILIVCAKLFDKEKCELLLNTNEKLQLFYIEGIEDSFNCTHSKFHLIEQPLTGSAIFDKLISFTNIKSNFILSDIAADQEKGSSYSGNILVAEDNETNQMLISIMLEERGLEYKIAGNGQIALDAIKENDIYDIIFMDINMPILDGIKATQTLRKNGYKKPIVSLSANVIESDIESFYEAGMDDTLNKPLVAKELDIILTKYLKNKPQQKKSSFDRVSLSQIAKVTSINNEKVILKLLFSFATSTKKIIKRLEVERLDEDILHNIKGMSANLRFENIAKLAEKLEKDISKWSELEHTEKKEEMLKHLKDVVQQIEELK
jgi:PAS domain S-box-containing protein